MSTFDMMEVQSNIRNYSVSFIDDLPGAIAADLSDGSVFCIIDQNVAELYSKQLHSVLQSGQHLIIEAIEQHKTLNHIELAIKSLLGSNIKRNTKIVAIGGGIIQDISGFISTVLFRGIDWIFYPTTLLAQCDSCIGSKTSINVGEFKNQLGTYYPPEAIRVHTDFLKTLATDDIKSGLGEIIKVHLLDGPDSLKFISDFPADRFSDVVSLRVLIERSLQIKKKIIEIDEFDNDYRNILNYGHTFGHAIESITDYKVCHGQAVTIGIDMANYISYRIGLLPEDAFQLMRIPILMNLPEYQLEKGHLDALLVALSRDKKNVDNNLMAILTKGPGQMLKRPISFDDVKKYLDEYRKGI